ncbi:fas-binding factor 1 homolog [Pterocles gutturalis]
MPRAREGPRGHWRGPRPLAVPWQRDALVGERSGCRSREVPAPSPQHRFVFGVEPTAGAVSRVCDFPPRVLRSQEKRREVGVCVSTSVRSPRNAEVEIGLAGAREGWDPAMASTPRRSLRDFKDPLADVLSNKELDASKKPAPTGAESSPEKKPERSQEKEPPPSQPWLHTVAPVRRKEELMSKDYGDEWLDAPAPGNGLKGDEKQGKKSEKEELRPARSKLAELLGRGSTSKILEQPGVGGLREFKQEKKDQRQPDKVKAKAQEGNAKPSESPDKPDAQEKKEDWWSALLSCDKAKAKTQEGNAKPSEAPDKPDAQEKKDDWLSALLSRDKAKAKTQEGNAKPSEAPGEGLEPRSAPAASPGAPQQAAALQDMAASTDGSRQPVPGLSTTKPASARPSEAAKGDPSRDASALVASALALFPREQEMQGPAPLTQVTAPGAHLQAAPQLQAASPALGLLHKRRLGAPASQLGEDASGCRALLLSAQARVAELESQVRMLELERTQHKQLLESLQKRHQADLDLLESSHRYQALAWAPLLCQSRNMEQAWAELLAQYQQRLATLEQQNALELQRLRELHRASIQEMRKKHEDELQLLKQLKDREMEAVTSTFSATRSLNGITEQVEKLFGDLRELSHKVEAVRHTTSEELATGARQRDQHLQMLQDRLLQHQRDMEEELSRHQQVMAKLEARLDEQARLLEQEQRRAAAEQSKVESLQRLLEEQRRMMTQQLSVERAELERAKEQAKMEAQEEQLRRDRELLEKSCQELRLEKEKVNGAMLRIRQQEEEEVKSMSELCSQKYEEGERALREACREVSEQQTSLQVMQQHLEQRKQQEQHLRQERLSMAHQRRQLQQLRQELRNNPTMLLTADQDLSAPTRGLSSTLFSLTVVAPHAWALVPGSPPPVRVLPWHSPVGRTETLSTAGSAGLHAALVLLKHWAQQDHDFLEEQQFFLESLKKAPYNTSSRPG